MNQKKTKMSGVTCQDETSSIVNKQLTHAWPFQSKCNASFYSPVWKTQFQPEALIIIRRTHSLFSDVKHFLYFIHCCSRYHLLLCIAQLNTLKILTFTVHAGLFVSRIQGTLTWITGSLICVCDLFACVYTQGASIYYLVCTAFVENLHRIWLWRNRRALVTHPCGHHARLCTTNSSTSSTCQSWKLYTIYHCSVTAHTTWFSTLLYDYTPVKCLEWSFSESVAEPPVNIQWPLWCVRKVPTCSSVLPDPLSHCCWHCGYNCPQNTGQPVQGKGEYCTVSNC